MNPDTIVGSALIAGSVVVLILWLAELAFVDWHYRRWQRNHPPQVTELGRLLDREHRTHAGRKP